jgi:hypothetical protein
MQRTHRKKLKAQAVLKGRIGLFSLNGEIGGGFAEFSRNGQKKNERETDFKGGSQDIIRLE